MRAIVFIIYFFFCFFFFTIVHCLFFFSRLTYIGDMYIPMHIQPYNVYPTPTSCNAYGKNIPYEHAYRRFFYDLEKSQYALYIERIYTSDAGYSRMLYVYVCVRSVSRLYSRMCYPSGHQFLHTFITSSEFLSPPRFVYIKYTTLFVDYMNHCCVFQNVYSDISFLMTPRFIFNSFIYNIYVCMYILCSLYIFTYIYNEYRLAVTS